MRLRTPIALLVVALATALVAQAVRRGGGEPPARERVAIVTRVVDGDTIGVRIGDATERVRYIGVDTPEEAGARGPAQCYARAATAFNARLVDGRRVRLVADAERRDRYGRLLAYVYREPDDLFVNAELVRRGYADTLAIVPNVRHARAFGDLARRAREAPVGRWEVCAPPTAR